MAVNLTKVRARINNIKKKIYYDKSIQTLKLYNVNDLILTENEIKKYKKKLIKIGLIDKDYNINIELLDPAFNNVMNSIKADKKIIILYHWRTSCKSDEHYALIDGVHDNKIKIINYAIDVPIGYISMRELKTMLMPFKRDNGDIVPKVWIIN